jgi:DNA topoisomerase VI subunit B
VTVPSYDLLLAEEQEPIRRKRGRPKGSKNKPKVAAVFQQAQKPTRGAQFLPIVAKPTARREHKLTRVAFRVSRLMEFCSEKELVNQTGHDVEYWPLVILKELFDNALDACEEAEVAPEIEIIVKAPATIVVRDNANGFDVGTIESILDYTIRVSSREAYVSPTRGAQGNALKTILAMGYVLDREEVGSAADAVGVTIIETRGVAHRIEFGVDHINNQPKISHSTSPSAFAAGTRITVIWPKQAADLVRQSENGFKDLAEAYVWFNPHLTLRGLCHGKEFISVKATDPNWEKWRPRNPTSPHWYNESRLQGYLAAHVARDRDLGRDGTVREFVGEFRGLSGTIVRRKILAELGCSHQSLAQFFGVERVNRVGIKNLLAAMQKYSKPVLPKHLGVIGREHLKTRFLAAGGNIETFKYELEAGYTEDGIPFVIEVAFGLHQAGLTWGPSSSLVTRKFAAGVNWSVAINNPFRTFGRTGQGLENMLAELRVTAGEPVICAVHLASAHVQYADRGKSSIILSGDEL